MNITSDEKPTKFEHQLLRPTQRLRDRARDRMEAAEEKRRKRKGEGSR
jgi:hypothetical protein